MVSTKSTIIYAPENKTEEVKAVSEVKFDAVSNTDETISINAGTLSSSYTTGESTEQAIKIPAIAPHFSITAQGDGIDTAFENGGEVSTNLFTIYNTDIRDTMKTYQRICPCDITWDPYYIYVLAYDAFPNNTDYTDFRGIGIIFATSGSSSGSVKLCYVYYNGKNLSMRIS